MVVKTNQFLISIMLLASDMRYIELIFLEALDTKHAYQFINCSKVSRCRLVFMVVHREYRVCLIDMSDRKLRPLSVINETDYACLQVYVACHFYSGYFIIARVTAELSKPL